VEAPQTHQATGMSPGRIKARTAEACTRKYAAQSSKPDTHATTSALRPAPQRESKIHQNEGQRQLPEEQGQDGVAAPAGHQSNSYEETEITMSTPATRPSTGENRGPKRKQLLSARPVTIACNSPGPPARLVARQARMQATTASAAAPSGSPVRLWPQ